MKTNEKRKEIASLIIKLIFCSLTAGFFAGAILSITGYGYFGFGLGIMAGTIIAFLLMLGALFSKALLNLRGSK